MGIVIAGERSGVGKTTVTLALLSYLSQQGRRIQSFKVGPDYIDPMFHRDVTGRSCRNLDPVLTSETYVQRCFAQHTQDIDGAIVEGVMGLFDGAAGRQDFASTAHIARLLNLPVLLVVDCSRMSYSIAALVQGYRYFDSRLQFAGVVLNRVGSDRHLELLKAALEPLHLPILGVLRRQDSITIPDRHLGLIPTAELSNLKAIIDQLAQIGQECFDWPKLLPLLELSNPLPTEHSREARDFDRPRPLLSKCPARVAIARDSAFSFYYPDNLDLLAELGAELIPWSPLRDRALPRGAQGLYLGGGFPEIFAAELAANQAAQHSVRQAIAAGMPTYAECGGLMYLCQAITTFEQARFPMVGVLPTTAVMGQRLTLGYRQAVAQHSTPLITQGETVWGHEFHRSHLTPPPPSPLFNFLSPSASRLPPPEGWYLPHLHASYLHLHWGDRAELPLRFLQQCQQFQPLS